MPQLMPLNWCLSFLLVVFLFIMMSLIYCEGYMNINIIEKDCKDYMINWKW